MMNPDYSELNHAGPIRVMMFPWLGYGHMVPYLELAKRLITRGFIIYLCSTPATLSGIQKKITSKLSLYIKQVPLLLPTSPDLPPEFHTTNGLPAHLMPKLKEAFDSSVDAFSDILTDLKPDLLIYDFLQPWAPSIAKEQNIPAVEFNTSSPTMTCFMNHYFKNPRTEFPFSKIYYRDYEWMNKKKLMDSALGSSKDKETMVAAAERSTKIVLIKGCRAIEGKYIDYVSSLVGKKYVPVGPLVQNPNDDDEIMSSSSLDILSWLDRKEKKSTIFVSFGTEYFLSQDELDGISYGLELSQVNFVWALMFPKSGEKTTLPLGFLERIGDRGKIIEGWAPQAKILQHASIGGLVTHCGWNSVLESIYFGVPIIAVPMQFDQPINARLVEEVGVGVEILRDENRKIHRETFAAGVRKVVVEDSGEVIRERAAEMREKLSSNDDEEIDEVVKELVELVVDNSGVVVRERAAEMREKLSSNDEEIDEVVKELVELCLQTSPVN